MFLGLYKRLRSVRRALLDSEILDSMVGLREFQAHCQSILKVPQVNHLEKH